jgi:hypothetical protein
MIGTPLFAIPLMAALAAPQSDAGLAVAPESEPEVPAAEEGAVDAIAAEPQLDVPTPGVQAELAVFPLEAVNLEPGAAAALEALFVEALAVLADVRFAAITHDAVDRAGGHVAAAREVGASRHLHLSAIGLGGRMVLAARLNDARGDELAGADMDALSLADARRVVPRLVMAVLEGVDVEETRTREA